MPSAKSIRSAITTEISEFHTGAGSAKTQIHNAPPTACAVNVAPSARAIRNRSRKKCAIMGISQKSEKYQTSRPMGGGGEGHKEGGRGGKNCAILFFLQI